MERNSFKKIIIIDNSLYPTGALKSILTITNKLKGHFDFVYVTPSESIKNELAKQHKVAYVFKFLELSKRPKALLYPLVLIWNSFKLYQLVRREKAEIIHVNDLYNMVGVVVKIFRPNIKLVHHVRLMPESYLKQLYFTWINILIKKSDKIICVSKSVFNAIKNSEKKIVIYDAMEDKESHPKKEIATGKSKTNLIYVGNFLKGKGQDFAARALKRLLELGFKVELTYIGSIDSPGNNYYYEILNYLKQENILDKVTFKQFIHDIEKEMKSGDILINFSESESFSMVCLEALYYGIPLVCTDSGGPAELFKNYESGVLVKNRNVDDMVVGIKHLIENPKKQYLYSRAGKLYVRDKFSLPKMASKLKLMYNS